MRIKFNTFIVILSVLSKACLMLPLASVITQVRWMHFQQRQKLIDFQLLDAASRGPLGSVCALFRVRNTLVIAAAALTVSAIGFEAVLQQSVNIGSWIYIPNISDLQNIRSETFNSWLREFRPVTAETYYSILQRGKYPAPVNVNFPCDSQECYSKLYSTMGFCSSCTNITDVIDTVCDIKGQCSSTLPTGQILHESSRAMTFSANPITDREEFSDRTLLANFSVLGAVPAPQSTIVKAPVRLGHMCQVNLCARVFQAFTPGGVAPFLLPVECDFARIENTRKVISGNETHIEIVFPEATTLSMIFPYTDGVCQKTTGRWPRPHFTFKADSTSVASLRSFFAYVFN